MRIEDTDIERSKKEYEDDIVSGLKWLGLDWDEGPDRGGDFGPYRQSERTELYDKYLKRLLDEKKAYYCFCSREELEKDREAMVSQGLVPKYNGKCRNLSEEEVNKRLLEGGGETAVIRFKMPEEKIEFEDLIRGKVSMDMSLIGDIVIARNLKSPLYALAGVIDDYEMRITHVIRGEDHISNTPKQIALQKALGLNSVEYAHLPLILAPDRSKLSKRFVETSLNDFRKQGYLPEALINFMAFLGWHPKGDLEILSPEELIKEFGINRVQKSGAIFNLEKLEWLNAQHIKKMSPEDLLDDLFEYIPNEWKSNKELLLKIIFVEKSRIKKLSEFKEKAEIFFELPDYDKRILIWNETSEQKTKEHLNLILKELEKIPDGFKKEFIEGILMPLTEIWGRGELLFPLRAALSGKTTSSGPFELLEILGREESIRRIGIAIDKL